MLKRIKSRYSKPVVRRWKNRALVTSAVISVTAVAVQGRALRLHNDYLKEKGLYDEYYAMPEE